MLLEAIIRVIQGTFRVIQGTFGLIQGTFGVIQGTFRGVVRVNVTQPQVVEGKRQMRVAGSRPYERENNMRKLPPMNK
jgi:hypothetical protein